MAASVCQEGVSNKVQCYPSMVLSNCILISSKNLIKLIVATKISGHRALFKIIIKNISFNRYVMSIIKFTKKKNTVETKPTK